MNVTETYNLEKLDLLLVEDNTFMQKLVKEILRVFRVSRVRAVPDVETAIREICHAPPDIVICDWMLGQTDGIDLVRWIRRDSECPNQEMPVLMLTAHTETSRVTEARDSGASDYLAKPISAKALYEHIVSAVENPRSFVENEKFVGPDRRRRSPPDELPNERRIIGEPVADSGADGDDVSKLSEGETSGETSGE